MRIIKQIPVDLIEIDRIPLGTRSLKYANSLMSGSIFPPIKVAKLKSGRYRMIDGRHRFLAHKMCEMKNIKAKFSTRVLKENDE